MEYPEYDEKSGLFFKYTERGDRVFEPGVYPWDAYLNHKPLIWTEEEIQCFNETLLARSNEWSETEKTKNQSIGEARAVQTIAMQEFFEKEKSQKVVKTGKKFFWITVNPSKEVSLIDLRNKIDRLYSKKWVQQSAYVFEITEGGHMHSHGLILANYESARAKRECGNTIRDICNIGNSHCYKFVNLGDDESLAQEKFSYMLGRKQDKKISDVDLTKTWRKENNLDDMYFYPKGSTILVGTLGNVVASADYSDIPL